jgi:hypothetical protein
MERTRARSGWYESTAGTGVDQTHHPAFRCPAVPMQLFNRMDNQRQMPYTVSPMVGQIRVLLADDSAHVRRAITALLSREPTVIVIGEVSSYPELMEKLREPKPDVVAMDIHMPGEDRVELQCSNGNSTVLACWQCPFGTTKQPTRLLKASELRSCWTKAVLPQLWCPQSKSACGKKAKPSTHSPTSHRMPVRQCLS